MQLEVIVAKKKLTEVSLRQAYRDLLLFSLFIGLIFSCILSLVIFIIYREIQFLLISFIFGVLSTLEGIAKFVAFVEFWRAIIDSWHKRRENKKDAEKKRNKVNTQHT